MGRADCSARSLAFVDYRPRGPDATRARLRSYVAAVIASTWPDEAPPPGATYPDTSKMRQVGEDPTLSEIMNQVGLDVRALKPADVFHQDPALRLLGDYARHHSPVDGR